MTNRMSVIGPEGDTKISWDPKDEESVMNAESMFKCLTGKGYRAFAVKNGEQSARLKSFDAAAGEIVMLRPLAGG